MPTWKIAAVQMDCAFTENEKNLAAIRTKLREAAANGARLVVFPECALTGYCFESLQEAMPHAEPIPGASTQILAEDCARLGVWAVVGMLERADASIYNACCLIGPRGVAGNYRKVHLPFLGVDRFTTRGDQSFAVHDLGGLRIGMNICYDGSFPEAARCLMLLGADLITDQLADRRHNDGENAHPGPRAGESSLLRRRQSRRHGTGLSIHRNESHLELHRRILGGERRRSADDSLRRHRSRQGARQTSRVHAGQIRTAPAKGSAAGNVWGDWQNGGALPGSGGDGCRG
jgi:hypothetical protein